MHNRLFGCAVAAALVFGSSMVLTIDQANASNKSQMDWNTAGNNPSYGNSDPNWLSTYLGPSVLSREPAISVITLQEVCFDQAHYFYFNYLQYRRGGWSYVSFYNALQTSTACGGQQYGNAVFRKGGGGVTSVRFAHQTSSAEKRGMACMNGQNGGGTLNIGVCSIHLVTNNVPVADCQVADAFAYSNGWIAAGDQIGMAGDFNIQLYSQTAPGNQYTRCFGQPLTYTNMQSVYAYPYYEGDQYYGSADQYTTCCTYKVDYVFISYNTNLWADLYVVNSYSDHRLLTAYINM